MALSANSLIHYTSELDNLLGIISSSGFRYSYCEEKVITRGNKSFSAAIAMVSFCDIPLSDYKKHFYNKRNSGDLGYYGDYGIGLSKKWANRNGLNSIFYIEYKSFVGTAIRKDFKNFINGNRFIDHAVPPQVFLYCKNYQGELFRKEASVIKEYRFYDEREWRLVPDNKMLNYQPPVIDISNYRKEKATYNARISANLLSFELEDISYIIVREESEVPLIYSKLQNVFHKDLIDLIAIRVLTSEQIISDF
ncbi:abortive infection system antitoxin AbiGi family protein [Pedobacter sp. MC2016-14]|uniref:abortive infection system antitoxin AbiGi family protein n=1 Tax=Pedobacter sp. MC2016-14 TaxID=2897327 RepID=UPI001E2AAB57|nr:abortive infection system antitoxin AbiGi family protein [Pedobacter sp. MC2016-14]MCD0489667.1 abortive infection system antitoxin AbiGi family protein [Pedobacter sp. MC2016-14]